MSTVAKIFSGILNNRLVHLLNLNEVMCDEQNVFRKLRQCFDHLYVLTTVIRHRKQRNQFVCFVDFPRAFDGVNHEMLMYKLLSVGVHGRIYCIIKTLYAHIRSVVHVNNYMIEWFNIETGVRQGDVLSSTLFSI